MASRTRTRYCPKSDLLRDQCAHCVGLEPDIRVDVSEVDPGCDAGRCRSCKAAILWATTDAGRPIPLDPEPDPDDGNVRVTDGQATVVGPLEAVLARDAGEDLYVTHFTSCPDADSWSRS